MRDISWLKDSMSLGRKGYEDDFHYNVTEEVYKKNPFVRITDLFIDKDDYLFVYYEFVADVKNGRKIEDKELRKQVEINIKEAVKNHTY